MKDKMVDLVFMIVAVFVLSIIFKVFTDMKYLDALKVSFISGVVLYLFNTILLPIVTKIFTKR